MVHTRYGRQANRGCISLLPADHRLPFDNLMNEDCVLYVYALYTTPLSVSVQSIACPSQSQDQKPVIIWSSLTCN